MKDKVEFYVASCVPCGGVYLCALDKDGRVYAKKELEMPSPMWLEADGDELWAVLRAPFDDSQNSGVAKYSLSDKRQSGDIASTQGEVACHLAVCEGELYAANYISGSVWSSRGKVVTHSGKGTDPVRQTSPHVHSVFFSSDKKYILCCDLGIDKIFVYDRELNFVSEANTPAGTGARHLVFSKDGSLVYAVSEMGAAVHIYEWNDGILTYVSDISVLPDGIFRGKGSAIRLNKDGRVLYVAERATETIVVFSVDGKRLTLLDRVDCRGSEPRDLMLIGDGGYAVCANQFSDSCSVYKVEESGTLTYLSSFDIPAPICVIEK